MMESAEHREEGLHGNEAALKKHLTGWQLPYVNVFKHFQIGEWKRCTKEGDVTTLMDRTVKSTVYKISGAVPAGNYIQFPRTSSQSLGLTGQFFYLLFKPIQSKFFFVHLDVVTDDNLIIRISFSNLFKEFKSTSTWLQFPFISNAPVGSVEEATCIGLASKDRLGIAPASVRWTLVCLNLQYMLSVYVNRRYSYVKSLRLCANMFVKNVFTSSTCYEPGLDITAARKLGLLASGIVPLPRELSFPFDKHEDWHAKYDHVKFPADGKAQVYRDVIPGQAKSAKSIHCGGPSNHANFSKAFGVDDATSMPDTTSTSHEKKMLGGELKYLKLQRRAKNSRDEKEHVSQLKPLPEVGLNEVKDIIANMEEDVHIYAGPSHSVSLRQEKANANMAASKSRKSAKPMKSEDNGPIRSLQSLEPDPIMEIRRVVGFGGATYKHAAWTSDGSYVIYPCHALIVVYDVKLNRQTFLLGHTDQVSALALGDESKLLASAQTGDDSVIRIWNFRKKTCSAVFLSHVQHARCLVLSSSEQKLCCVGDDGGDKQIVAVWDTSRLRRGGKVELICKAHATVSIESIKFAPFDDARMVSCGRHNIRVWRIKPGSLRSSCIELGDHTDVVFTDLAFEVITRLVEDLTDRKMYITTASCSVYQVNYRDRRLCNIYSLLPADVRSSHGRSVSQLTCISVSESFCAIGADDGSLRLWPLDFKSYFLDAEHDGPLSVVSISKDGLSVLAGTSSGNLGIMNLAKKSYSTITRSHNEPVVTFAFDVVLRNVATISVDGSIRIWSQDKLAQVYEFRTEAEVPTSVACHPRRPVFACGFASGSVRVFSLTTTSMIWEQCNLSASVFDVMFSPSGDCLVIADRAGTLAIHDATVDKFSLIRTVTNVVLCDPTAQSSLISFDANGHRLVVIGPSELMVTVLDGRSLDELLRVDVTSLTSQRKVRSIDAATHVCFAPLCVGHLLVVTSASHLLKLSSKTGQLLSEVAGIHRGGVTSICCSPSGKFLATAGDCTIKIWDYHMRLDINFQVFIGHSSPITRIQFTADERQLYSCAESLFVWDFHGNIGHLQPRDSPSTPVEKGTAISQDYSVMISPKERNSLLTDSIRSAAPRPESGPVPLNRSFLSGQNSPRERSRPRLKSDDSSGDHNETGNRSGETERSARSERSPKLSLSHVSKTATISDDRVQESPDPSSLAPVELVSHHAPPNVMAHFKAREKMSRLSDKRFVAQPNQAGIRLSAAIGYDGQGRNNIIWHPRSGLFIYPSGSMVVVEDLSSGAQRHLRGHVEGISTLALSNDGESLASAGVVGPSEKYGKINIWELSTGACRKVLQHHQCCVIGMEYSRDDRFLLSVGDFSECSVVVWSTLGYKLLSASAASSPIHSAKWDPFSVNEFVTVGRNKSVIFWFLEEGRGSCSLKLHQAEVPLGMFGFEDSSQDLTSVCYSGNDVLYIASASGTVSAWDTKRNACFLHWEADTSEIPCLSGKHGKLITGGVSHALRLWTVTGVGDMKVPGAQLSEIKNHGLLMEAEIKLDGAVISAVFDEDLDMGIAGTTAGTLWYVNFEDQSSVRIVSGHGRKVNDIAFMGGDDAYFATCSSDGSLRLWANESREQTVQFLVMDKGCNCIAFCPASSPHPVSSAGPDRYNETILPAPTENSPATRCVAGYTDGTVRLFDFERVELALKMQPHRTSVSSVACSPDGRVVMSGNATGFIAVSSTATGITVRVLADHKGAPITGIQVSQHADHPYASSSPVLWLASSADQRVSVWSADWSKDVCELVDWLTFPAPGFAPNGMALDKQDMNRFKMLPPSLAVFSPTDPDVVVYTGYGIQKEVLFYSLSKKSVLRSISLADWAISMDVSPQGHLIALGFEGRLVKLVDYDKGTFQDFAAHTDATSVTRFSSSGRRLYTAAYDELFVWDVLV